MGTRLCETLAKALMRFCEIGLSTAGFLNKNMSLSGLVNTGSAADLRAGEREPALLCAGQPLDAPSGPCRCAGASLETEGHLDTHEGQQTEVGQQALRTSSPVPVV